MASHWWSEVFWLSVLSGQVRLQLPWSPASPEKQHPPWIIIFPWPPSGRMIFCGVCRIVHPLLDARSCTRYFRSNFCLHFVNGAWPRSIQEMSYNTASKIVSLLVEKGILQQTDRSGKARIFSYSEYLDILRKDTWKFLPPRPVTRLSGFFHAPAKRMRLFRSQYKHVRFVFMPRSGQNVYAQSQVPCV